MSITVDWNKKNWLLFPMLLLVGIGIIMLTKLPWWWLPIYGVALAGLLALQVEWKEGIPWIPTIVMFVLGSAFSVFSVQYVILDDENFHRTSSTMLFLNFLCVLMVYFILLMITARPRLSANVAHSALLIFGLIDYFVWTFRQNEFTVGDILGAGTGLSVASKYHLQFSPHCGIVFLGTILFYVITGKFQVYFRVIWQSRLVSALLSICIGIYVTLNAMDINTETWEQKGSYRNGYILNFALGVRDCFVSEPEDYSPEAIAELGEYYENQTKALTESPQKSDKYRENVALEEGQKPTVIVIMNESFSDLSVIGPFDTNIPVMPFVSSLEENTTKGYALASVYGAKTPNSEWEFLTGNSMAFLPDGSVAYQQYLRKNPYSLVSTLKEEGYTAVAMHPYYETGWSRNHVYPSMGFDEKYFIQDFDQTKLLREYITDQELYRKIIERFEAKQAGENLFIMSVTMQNHGGYTTDYDNFDEQVHKIGMSYNDANQYLSLVHESDKAIQELISYFQSVEEPVEIVFFGDHQPGLNSSFYPLLNNKGLSGLTTKELEDLYTVPFFIWTNYDSEETTVERTSLNYLSTMALKKAGIDLPPYHQFLADLMDEIPAINSRGYYSNSQGDYIHVEDATGEEAQWIDRYQMLQYNSMFDKKNRNTTFFPFMKNSGK